MYYFLLPSIGSYNFILVIAAVLPAILLMIRVYRALREEGLKSRLILQIHDELIIHTELEELDRVKKLLVDNMESAVTMNVALKADLNEGGNWYELK